MAALVRGNRSTEALRLFDEMVDPREYQSQSTANEKDQQNSSSGFSSVLVRDEYSYG
jgi:hypothetical protein